MNDSKTSKSKKEQKTSFKEIIIESDEKEDVKDPEADKNFGLHPSEVEDEISQAPKIEVPERESDVKVQVKELPDPTVREEQRKPSMITIEKSEALNQSKQTERRCPFDATLACKDCRLFQIFLNTEGQRMCSITRIAQRMPL